MYEGRRKKKRTKKDEEEDKKRKKEKSTYPARECSRVKSSRKSRRVRAGLQYLALVETGQHWSSGGRSECLETLPLLA